jgi:hypothetical protein
MTVVAVFLPIRPYVYVRRNVVGVALATLASAVNEHVIVRRNVIRIALTALALAVYEIMNVRVLIGSGSIKIYASLCIVGVVVSAAFKAFIVNPLTTVKSVISAYNKA